jgi:hypothetical protein
LKKLVPRRLAGVKEIGVEKSNEMNDPQQQQPVFKVRTTMLFFKQYKGFSKNEGFFLNKNKPRWRFSHLKTTKM